MSCLPIFVRLVLRLLFLNFTILLFPPVSSNKKGKKTCTEKPSSSLVEMRCSVPVIAFILRTLAVPPCVAAFVFEVFSMNISKLLSRRVLTALFEAACAVVCAVCAGCKLACGELTLRDLHSDIILPYMIDSCSITNTVTL